MGSGDDMNNAILSYQVGITTPLFYFSKINNYLAEHSAGYNLLPCASEAELITTMRDMDVILTTSAPFTKKVLYSLTKCKGIVRIGIGVDNFDLKAATEHGIYIANVPDFYVEDVATLTITFILALARKIFQVNDAIKLGTWRLEEVMPLHRLSSLTVGLLGFGRITGAVIEKLKPFGSPILVHDPYVPDDVIKDKGVEPVSLNRLLSESDFFSIHCPLNRETKNLIDESALRRMKKNSCLINTARGGIVDEEALLQALREQRIAGAASDVFFREPPEANDPLIRHPGLIASPHIGWYSEESRNEAAIKAAEEAVRILLGKVPVNLVNREVVR
jgi:D-3-phosphoglycerate dehydrogenase